MKCDAYGSPASVATSIRYAPYNSAISASASTSTASVWSDTASQSSDDTSISTNTSDSDSCDSYCLSKRATATASEKAANFRRSLLQRETETSVPAELRQNPRRTAGSHARSAAPPALVRQSDRKINFVDNLVGRSQQLFLDSLIQCLIHPCTDSSTQIVEAIWPLSSVICRNEQNSKAVLPLRTFIQETLRRSRTSYSTLQVALYYLILIKPHVPKHNFTTEQPEDRYSDRALQCGRRMFLAALILASKYLQDRNYSARAWSKISGLNTQEINQNEIAFLLAVNWKLHIADEVFQRWTEMVLKYTPPPSPPSPGGVSPAIAQQTADWKQIILKLDPELTNIEGLIPQVCSKTSDLSVMSPRSILNGPQDARGAETSNAIQTPKPCNVPAFMEPMPSSLHTPGRLAPALGLLPTPRLTPQTSGFCTPAVSAASQIMGKCGAMGLAMAQASTMNTAQNLDRFPCSSTSSPQGYCPARRSSLANSVSTMSSPESMVSDTSRSSRSSSISSASSLVSATNYTSSGRGSVPSRFRATKLWNDKVCVRPTVPSVPEDYNEPCRSVSPESYTGPVNKLGDLTLETPLARREMDLDDMARDPASDAARALQDLHRQASANATPTARTGCKRSRTSSMDNTLQDNVREILSGSYAAPQPGWADSLVLSSRGAVASDSYLQFPGRPNVGASGKRVCCSAEAASGYTTANIHPAISLRGPGMWDGILN
ncbi:G1/S-specific cyclin Pcl5 [Purpureocillium lavendulum]|uniref:G1/S-specific cyclin Pcl5 n=1 Tax=Purpureocillium lavendulum TaxID=1247861 RepID=A0AB34FXQ1_9HYPO|nr:G1/S-specific cyclin Pcl5 [Purpureocillium lavendulum]